VKPSIDSECPRLNLRSDYLSPPLFDLESVMMPHQKVSSASSMQRSRGRRNVFSIFAKLVLTGIMLCTIPGCNYFLLLGYLIGGPPQIEPLFEKETNKSMTDKDIRVAVVCYASDELKYQFDNIDHIIANRVTNQIASKKIEVVNYAEVQTWLRDNPDWDTAVEVGAEFDVNYVIYIDVSAFSLYERDSNTLFRGRCDAIVSVYEMETDGDGKRIFSREVNSIFPIQVPRSAADVSYDTFRMEYIWRLSDEIGRMFYPYLHGDDISSAA
jgi:hypothetical protein